MFQKKMCSGEVPLYIYFTFISPCLSLSQILVLGIVWSDNNDLHASGIFGVNTQLLQPWVLYLYSRHCNLQIEATLFLNFTSCWSCPSPCSLSQTSAYISGGLRALPRSAWLTSLTWRKCVAPYSNPPATFTFRPVCSWAELADSAR